MYTKIDNLHYVGLFEYFTHHFYVPIVSYNATKLQKIS